MPTCSRFMSLLTQSLLACTTSSHSLMRCNGATVGRWMLVSVLVNVKFFYAPSLPSRSPRFQQAAAKLEHHQELCTSTVGCKHLHSLPFPCPPRLSCPAPMPSHLHRPLPHKLQQVVLVVAQAVQSKSRVVLQREWGGHGHERCAQQCGQHVVQTGRDGSPLCCAPHALPAPAGWTGTSPAGPAAAAALPGPRCPPAAGCEQGRDSEALAAQTGSQAQETGGSTQHAL